MAKNKEFLFRHGELVVNTAQQGSTDLLQAGKDFTVQHTDEMVKKILTGDALKVFDVSSGGNEYSISVKRPTARYSEPGYSFFMSHNSPADFNPAKTYLIYDAPPEIQKKYWQTVVTMLNGLNELTQKEKHPLVGSQVYLTGHHCRFVQIDGKPSARTVKLHHDHLMVVPPGISGNSYQASEYALPYETKLQNEQYHRKGMKKRLPYFLENFVYFLQDSFRVPMYSKEEADEYPITIRSTAPFGYSFDIANNPKVLAETLEKHFHAYKAAMEASEFLEQEVLGLNIAAELGMYVNPDPKFANKKGRVIQPAFTFYLVPKNEAELTVVISPMLTGIGGPERAGLLLKRSPENPTIYTARQTKKINKDVHDIVKSITF